MTCCPKQPNQATTLRQSPDTIAALYHSAAQMMATHSLGFRSSSPASRISTCKGPAHNGRGRIGQSRRKTSTIDPRDQQFTDKPWYKPTTLPKYHKSSCKNVFLIEVAKLHNKLLTDCSQSVADHKIHCQVPCYSTKQFQLLYIGKPRLTHWQTHAPPSR
jgi:hypothetical protein